MKTKTNILKSIIFLLLSITYSASLADLSENDSVTPLTSGVKYSYYEVTWCSPHYDKINSLSNICEKGYFNNVGGVGVMTYKGENFKNGNVTLKNTLPDTTRSSSIGMLDLFDVSSIKFEGEGTYTIKVLLVDYAYNASKFDFTYKIDKTAPQFQLSSISENTPYTYVDNSIPRLTTLNGNVVKYDSNSDISNDRDKYQNPNPEGYLGDTPLQRNTHQRNDLYVLYFKNLSNDAISLNVNYSDEYNGYLKGGNNYIAGENKFSLLSETGNNEIYSGITLGNSVNIPTEKFSDNTENSQKKYRLRLYDKTIGKDTNKTPNYSEIIFYAVRDNTPPNMGGNGLASNKKDAIEKTLLFDDSSTTAWDTNTTSYNPENNGSVSKFLKANINENLYSSLSDIGIGENNSSKYPWYNAGIPTGGGTKIDIEKANDNNDYSEVITYNNRFSNISSRAKNFSIVDLANERQNGYRKYTTKFITNGISGDDKLCDNVGNCLNPKIDFRVVASELASNTSNITLNSDPKVFANASDKYSVNIKLEDTYGNKIVGVKAIENGGKIIKEVDSYFDFYNGLYNDLSGQSGSGTKQVITLDTQNDNLSNSLSTINTSGDIYFKEKAEGVDIAQNQNAGIYTFDIKSKSPSKGGYKYLNGNALLKLISIKPKSYGDISGVGYYKSIGYFDNQSSNNINLSGNSNFLSTNIDFINNSDYKTDLTASEKNNYGKITLNNASGVKFNTLNSRKLEFDFASPFIYGAEDLSLSHLVNNIGQKGNHTKKGYLLSLDNLTSTKVYEKYLPSYTASGASKKFTPDIFNILSSNSSTDDVVFDTSKINDGTNINIPSDDYSVEYKTKSSPIKSNYQISGYGLNMGYISHLDYKISGTQIKIPSISRNIGPSIDGDQKYLSMNYFPESGSPLEGKGGYVILGDPIISAGILSSMGIGITGLSNNIDYMLLDDNTGLKANVNIGDKLTRYDVMTNFKTNVKNTSNGITWCNGNVTLDQELINNPKGNGSILNDCSIQINGEMISYINGNIDISCGLGKVCNIKNNFKRTIITKNGSVYINSNITTFGKDSKLLIGSIAESGLQNITIPNTDNPSIARDNKLDGWILINPYVTNIDSFLVAQGPIVSYDGKLYNSPNETQLKNQLHIYGATLSLNTIGGYKSETDSECPYIAKDSCSQKTAFIFDLVTLRRYSLVGESAGSSNLIPSGNGYRSGRNNSVLTTNGANPPVITSADTSGTNNLRYISDKDYIVYPMFIQKDTSWTNDPSIMFKNN